MDSRLPFMQIRFVPLLVLLYSASGPARGADSDTPRSDYLGDPLVVSGATALANGGAARGDTTDFANIQLAPAVLALLPQYLVDGEGFVHPDGVRGFQVGAMDSKTSPVTFGLSYRYGQQDDFPVESEDLPGWKQEGTSIENAAAAHTVVGAAALATQDRRFAVGVGGQYWNRATTLAGDGYGFRATANVAARPVDEFSIALGGAVPIADEGAQGLEGTAWVDGGLRWAPSEYVALSGDVLVPLPEPALAGSLGLALLPTDTVPIRFGLYHASAESVTGLTAGLSVTSDTAALDYGLRLDVVPGSEATESLPDWHRLGLRIWF